MKPAIALLAGVVTAALLLTIAFLRELLTRQAASTVRIGPDDDDEGYGLGI